MIGRESFISSLLSGGLLALSSGGLLLLLGGGVLSSRLGLRRGPEGLVGVSTDWRNHDVCAFHLTRLSLRSCMIRVESL